MILRILLALTLAFGLAACGKKAGSLKPPEGTNSAYPRSYPSS